MCSSSLRELFFLTHVDARAAADCRREEGGKSVRALRWIDPQTRFAGLGVSVCIATDETPLLSPPVEFNHWNQLLSSDLAMARSPPPQAAIPAYPAQNETCCRSAQHRISALATGPRIAEKGWRSVWRGEGTCGDRWRTTQGATRADSPDPAGQYFAPVDEKKL